MPPGARALVLALLAACSHGPAGAIDPAPTFTVEERAALALLSPSVLPAPAHDVTNAYGDDAAAAAFGQLLFFTPRFAGALLDGDNSGDEHTLGRQGETGKVACAGCHLPTQDFNDTRSPSAQISLASGWGRRRAPSLLDVGQARLIMWDGRRDALYNQVFGPIESAVEMNSSRLFVAEQIFAHQRSQYEAVFGPIPAQLDDATRFPQLSADQTGCRSLEPYSNRGIDCHGMPGDGAEYDSMSPADQDVITRVVVNMGKAIAAYERLLACGQSRFDRWMRGDKSALSASEQRGAQVFVGLGRCVGCHAGPFFSDQKFHDIGLAPQPVAAAFVDGNDDGAIAGLGAALTDPLNSRGAYSDGDDGRLPASLPTSLEGAFRTPTLRCASRRPSFFHTGQARTLDDVVDLFDHGGAAGGYLGTNELVPLKLSAQQKMDLVAFLKALDGPGAASALTQASGPN
jgi:cytochrome c peroxidase